MDKSVQQYNMHNNSYSFICFLRYHFEIYIETQLNCSYYEYSQTASFHKTFFYYEEKRIILTTNSSNEIAYRTRILTKKNSSILKQNNT